MIRNHRRWKTWVESRNDTSSDKVPTQPSAVDESDEFRIDLELFKDSVKSLMLPSEELVVAHGVHSLSDHPQLSTAIFKSIRERSVQIPGEENKHTVETRPYLDSAILLDLLSHSTDSIVHPLLSTTVDLDPLLLQSKQTNHRILPVFVFSLLGLPTNLLVDERQMYIATQKCVIVLQTADNAIPLPYFSQGELLQHNGRCVMKSLLSGVGESLGLTPSYQQWDKHNQALSEDWLWGVGAFPFGPFSNSLSYSEHYRTLLLRHSIISRVTAVIESVKQVVGNVEEFGKAFVEQYDLELTDTGKQSFKILSFDAKQKHGEVSQTQHLKL